MYFFIQFSRYHTSNALPVASLRYNSTEETSKLRTSIDAVERQLKSLDTMLKPRLEFLRNCCKNVQRKLHHH